MFDFLKKNESQVDEVKKDEHQQGESAPGTSIHYQVDLIDDLKSEHEMLVYIYTEAGLAVNKKDFKLALSKLLNFKKILQTHLLTENIRLYVYLKHCFAKDKEQAKLIHDFQKEMASIGVEAMNFLNKFQTEGINNNNADDFLSTHEEIGQVLLKRISKEENILYPLYKPAADISK